MLNRKECPRKRLDESATSHFWSNQRVPGSSPGRLTTSLALILAEFIAAGDLSSRLNAFVKLKEWTASSPGSDGINRLEFLFGFLEAHKDLCLHFQSTIREILIEIRSVELFAEAGLHPREHLWSEAWRRIMEKLLPSAREDTDLCKLAFRLYPTSKSIERLAAMPDDVFERMARLISPVDHINVWGKQKEDLTQALQLLAVHVVGIGLSPGLRTRSRSSAIEDCRFYQLQRCTGELIRQSGATAVLEVWLSKVRQCREEMDYIHQRMEDTGVSTALVFDMKTIERPTARWRSSRRYSTLPYNTM